MNAEPTQSGGNSTDGGNGIDHSRARSVGELASDATHQIGESLERGKVKLSEFRTALTEKARERMDQTDTYVRDNPWRAVGWAAGIGFLLGILIRRR
jgi:ElaB/YqjD/DUF883 family membrane-anchored ribosome-binding protein